MKLGIQICSELEWECAKSILKIKRNDAQRQPFGEYFARSFGRHECICYHSGATKTKAAAACQFAIDTFHPDAVINLGTCGGVAENIRKFNIILAKKTFQYDVIQRFGKPSLHFKRDLKTNLDMSWIDLRRVLRKIRIGTIASADQDPDDELCGQLQGKKVLAADWESASIAKICKLNKIKCLILRGVSDIPEKRRESKEDIQERDYKKNTRIIMKDLLSIIGQIEFDKLF